MTATATGVFLTVAATAFLLATQLGPAKQWVDTLNDHRQGRGSVAGLILPPFGKAKGTRARKGQPMYDPARVMQFVRDVRDATGQKKPFPFVTQMYRFADVPGMSEDLWRVRIVTPVPAPTISRAP